MKAFIGCDPGESGGIAIIAEGIQPWAVKMPETERDLWDTMQGLRAWADREVVAAVEVVHSFPGQGVSSTFTFGRGYGALRMAIIAAGIPLREVQPRAWQKALGCLTGGDKNVSKRMAQQLFPTLKINHCISDALLIAEWLRRQP